jgi:hypothetical protein
MTRLNGFPKAYKGRIRGGARVSLVVRTGADGDPLRKRYLWGNMEMKAILGAFIDRPNHYNIMPAIQEIKRKLGVFRGCT